MDFGLFVTSLVVSFIAWAHKQFHDRPILQKRLVAERAKLATLPGLRETRAKRSRKVAAKRCILYKLQEELAALNAPQTTRRPPYNKKNLKNFNTKSGKPAWIP